MFDVKRSQFSIHTYRSMRYQSIEDTDIMGKVMGSEICIGALIISGGRPEELILFDLFFNLALLGSIATALQ